MKYLVLGVIAAAAIPFCSIADTLGVKADLSFYDRHIVADGVTWSAQNDIIHSKGTGESYLVVPGTYDDFVLTIEFKPDATVNGGIYMRCQDPKKIKANTCYEANIWDAAKNQEFRTGSVVKRQTYISKQDTANQWNTYELTMVGQHLKVRLNGVVTAEMNNVEYADGFIAIQHKGKGEFKMRNLNIRKL
ncbi:3-keto-disaccharide hydrolase [Shewanella maritima]|nr:DUF1080 domain-containing protein [Shewanella maritima]